MKPSNFKFLHQLGSGAYGEVMKVVHKKTEKIYALKIMSKKFIEKNKKTYAVFREKEILSFVRSPNIIKMPASFQDSKNIYLLTEYVEGCELNELITKHSRLDSCLIQFVLKQLLEALYCLKKLGIYHGDLKPQNIIITKNYRVKLVDFGNSDLFEKNHLNRELYKKLKIFRERLRCKSKIEINGTVPFVSPEIIDKGRYDFGSDIWALGIF